MALRLFWRSTITVPQLLQAEHLIYTLCLMQFYPELTLVLNDKALMVDRPSSLIKMSFLTQPMLSTSTGCEAPSKSRGIVAAAAVKSIADKQNQHCTHDKAQLQPCLQCLGTVWFNSTEGSLFWFPRWDNSEFEQDLSQLPLPFIETLLKLVFWYPVSPE